MKKYAFLLLFTSILANLDSISDIPLIPLSELPLGDSTYQLVRESTPTFEFLDNNEQIAPDTYQTPDTNIVNSDSKTPATQSVYPDNVALISHLPDAQTVPEPEIEWVLNEKILELTELHEVILDDLATPDRKLRSMRRILRETNKKYKKPSSSEDYYIIDASDDIVDAQTHLMGDTALHMAIDKGFLQGVRLLLRNYASNIRNYFGETPVTLAYSKYQDAMGTEKEAIYRQIYKLVQKHLDPIF